MNIYTHICICTYIYAYICVCICACIWFRGVDGKNQNHWFRCVLYSYVFGKAFIMFSIVDKPNIVSANFILVIQHCKHLFITHIYRHVYIHQHIWLYLWQPVKLIRSIVVLLHALFLKYASYTRAVYSRELITCHHHNILCVFYSIPCVG